MPVVLTEAAVSVHGFVLLRRSQLNSYRRKHFVPFGDTEKTEALAKTGAGKTDVTPEKTVLSEYGRVEILRKLHQLDAAVREVMYLRILGDLSFAQIGEITGRSRKLGPGNLLSR